MDGIFAQAVHWTDSNVSQMINDLKDTQLNALQWNEWVPKKADLTIYISLKCFQIDHATNFVAWSATAFNIFIYPIHVVAIDMLIYKFIW